jgi:hypothetical protein
LNLKYGWLNSDKERITIVNRLEKERIDHEIYIRINANRGTEIGARLREEDYTWLMSYRTEEEKNGTPEEPTTIEEVREWHMGEYETTEVVGRAEYLHLDVEDAMEDLMSIHLEDY